MARTYEPDVNAIMAVTEEEKAYIAGFFDGEGHVNVSNVDGAKGFRLACKVAISQKRPAVLQWLHTVFGGSLYKETKKTSNITGYVPKGGNWVWSLHGKFGPRIFLKLIVPYIRVKKEEVETALYILENEDTMSDDEKRDSATKLKTLRLVQKEECNAAH